MKKTFYGFLACVLALCLTLPAFAAPRMPENRGALTDDANALGAQTARDIQEYAELAEDETDVKIHVALTHFFDGVEAKTYARQLFEKWDLGKNDLLLVGAAGEDVFAIAMGKTVEKELGASNAENLLYTSSSFASLFRAQEYDAAFSSFFLALNDLLCKQYGEEIELGELFRRQSGAEKQTTSSSPALWEQILGSMSENTEDYQENHSQEENGLGVGGWVILAILIAIIFGQSDPVRKSRNQHRGQHRNYGCGCSPLGWILTLIGAGTIIDKLRRRR